MTPTAASPQSRRSRVGVITMPRVSGRRGSQMRRASRRVASSTRPAAAISSHPPPARSRGHRNRHGLPGDGINGLMEGLRRHQDRVRFVLVHHEEAAAFMATAHAKATGKIGVCLATSGPGGIHLLNGLYDAKLDHMPVLAITGMQETSVLGTGYQQEVNLDKLYADVTEYDQMIYNPVQLPAVVDNAIRTAYARRGVAHITVPNDIQVADAGADPWQHVAPARPPHTAPVMLQAPGRPAD